MYNIIFRKIFPSDAIGDFSRSIDGLHDIVTVDDDNTFVVKNVFKKNYSVGVQIQFDGFKIFLFDNHQQIVKIPVFGYQKGYKVVLCFEDEIDALIEFYSCSVKLDFD